MTRGAAPRILAAECRGELYLGMARCLDAGMAAERALATMTGVCAGRLDAELGRAAAAAAQGRALTLAGAVQGLWAPADRRVLGAAERLGMLGHAFGRLARRYEGRSARARRLRGRLLMPVFVLVLGVFVAPLPGLFTGSVSAAGYVARTVVPLAALAVATQFCVAVLRRWELQIWPDWAARLVLAFPLAGDLVRLRARVAVLENLALLLEAGQPAGDAVPVAVECTANPRLRRGFEDASSNLHKGLSVADALRDAGLLDPREGYPQISAGESAGRLPTSLEHYASAEDERLTQSYELIFEWIPRLVYALVLAVLGASLII